MGSYNSRPAQDPPRQPAPSGSGGQQFAPVQTSGQHGYHQYYGQAPGGRMAGTNGAQLQQAPPPQYQTQPRPAEQTLRTSTIRNNVNLKKQSLTVEHDAVDSSLLRVKFSFDAALPCSISVFFMASEDQQSACKLTSASGYAPPRQTRDLGLAQSYTTGDADSLRLTDFDVKDLTTVTQNTYPVVIRIETTGAPPAEGSAEASQTRVLPEPAGSPLPTWAQTQTTYATLTEREDGTLSIQVVKQKIWVEGVSYELQEIYGIENCGIGGEDAGSGKECVICLCENRDTTVLPCRHMCMCSGCARMLRHQSNRCPICRSKVESLLEIKVTKSR
mmetsp:Transcript_23001/g.74959  ORF Transcript_23001/g.74959 Transcript_23001/m.74959 type:complete len:331 (-) Transcript_23001:101-1093(-)